MCNKPYESRQQELFLVTLIPGILASLFVIVRLGAKPLLHIKYGLDDYLMIFVTASTFLSLIRFHAKSSRS